MSTTNKIGNVQTVLGTVSPEELGPTLTHEHLLCDVSVLRHPPSEASALHLFHRPVSMEILGYLNHGGVTNLDNAKLLDIDTAIDEAYLYALNGGGCLVDATSIGLSRDPTGLAQIARATGLNIVMGSSYYVDEAHPEYVSTKSEDEIMDGIVRDVIEGVDGTGICSGIIGEVGCSWPITDNERKVLRASARAQRITGAPLLIHPGRNENAPLEIITLLDQATADLNRTIMGHIDRTISKRETLKQVAESGCYLEWDLFGREYSYYDPNPDFDMPTDAMRMDQIEWVSAMGFGDKVVVAHDICHKTRLVKYGGHGYFHILSNIVPRMKARGFDETSIEMILVENPARILTFTEPQAP